MNKTVTERVKHAAERARDKSYGESVDESICDHAYIMAELDAIKAGLILLANIIEEYDEIIRGRR